MRILGIGGENLASLERFEVRLADGPLAGAGLLVICGPTGAGKSTLLDALCLALYDRTPRLGGDSLAVVQKGAVKALAQVDFRDSQGQRWRAIWRTHRAHRKLTGEWQPTQLELHNLDTGAEHSSHRKKETLQRIEDKIGLGFEQFCRSVLLAQGDFARFLHETGKERARLLETITGGEIYTELSQRTFLHHKAAREQLEQLDLEAAQSRVLGDEQRAELEAQQAAAAAADKWASEPTEENRRVAQQAAESVQSRTPAGWIALAVPYIGGGCLAMLYVRLLPELGFALMLYLLLVVWGTDIGAYFTGRTLQGPKLLPKVSPSKTWSGLLGGMGLASLLAFILAAVHHIQQPGLAVALALRSAGVGQDDVACAGGHLIDQVLVQFAGRDQLTGTACAPPRASTVVRIIGLPFQRW